MTQRARGTRTAAIAWRAWAALLAALPFVLREDAVFAFQCPTLFSPLQFSVYSLGAATLALALWNAFARRRLPVVAVRLGVVVGVLGTMAALVCELGWVPMRLGDLSLVPWHKTFETVGSVSQVIALVGWVCLGLGGGACSHEEKETAPGRMRLVLSRALLVSALLPFLALLALVLWSSVALSVALCAASAAAAWAGCARLSREGLQGRSLFGVLTVVMLGLLLSAAAREALSALAVSPVGVRGVVVAAMDDPVLVWSSICCVVAYALAVIAVARVVSKAPFSIGNSEVISTGGVDLRCLRGVEEGLALLSGGEELSPRERTTIARVALGMTNAKIAEELGLSPGTISDYRRRGMRKLGLSSRAEVVAALAEHGVPLEAGPDAAPEEKDAGRRGGRVVLLVLSLLLLVRPTFNFFHVYAYVMLTACLLVAAFLLCRSFFSGPSGLSDKEWSEGDSVSPRPLSMAVAAIFGLELYQWWGSNDSAWRMAIAVFAPYALALGLDATGFSVPANIRGVARGVVGVTLLGVRRLFLLNWQVLAVAGSLFALAPIVGEIGQGFQLSVSWIAVTAFSWYELVVTARRWIKGTATSSSHAEDRVMAYLRGRGLGRTEAQVVFFTALGVTRHKIQVDLNVSAGTVNSCRAAGYMKLGVHSRDELRALLRRDAGLKP